ncbi:MAG TPA: lipocalin-like domain-containing protein [Burkholderiales bacterium]|nr:lipocalin-like domain-containing protein [Burkholderiales bacterium]
MSRLVGVWKLERWTSEEGEPFGPGPVGTLIYTAEGTMISCFMRRDRTPVAASMEELAAWRRRPRSKDLERRFVEAALSFNSYCGRYSIEGTQVHHDVEIALFPDWIGKRLTRDFRLDGDRLALSFGRDVLYWLRRANADAVL